MRLRLELTAPCLLAPTLYPPLPLLAKRPPFPLHKGDSGQGVTLN